MTKSGVVPATTTGRGFEPFYVARRIQESQSIVSFELVPLDAKRSLTFIAGQFIAVRLPMPDGDTLLRHYSLSGDPHNTSCWRISVKLECSPPGRGSTYLHHNIDVGDLVDLAGPAGAFVCDEDNQRPVILMSGGVGVTPLVSMLHRLVRSSLRRVHFVHACENGAIHAFAEEVNSLAVGRSGIDVHVCYRNPLDDDQGRGAYDSVGILTKVSLQAMLPLDDYEVYLCGPAGFMQANWLLLRDLGVARERIHYEFFGPAKVLEDQPLEACDAETGQAVVAHVAASNSSAVTVRFHPQGNPIPWIPSFNSLLEMAENEGYSPAFNCRAGLCNACLTPLLSGSVRYIEEPLAPPPDGMLLLCCTRPVTPVTLALELTLD